MIWPRKKFQRIRPDFISEEYEYSADEGLNDPFREESEDHFGRQVGRRNRKQEFYWPGFK